MVKRGRRNKSGRRGKDRDIGTNAGPGERETRPEGERPSRGSFFRDLLLGLLVCVAFFVILETALRIAGVPGPAETGDPYVGFSAIQPLFEVKDGIASTAPGRLKYFNKVSFPVKKKPGTLRIFCFGGSTTYGRPFDGRTAFPRWLKELLAASAPGTHFEVINAGGISYASYRIVPLVKEALRFDPDLMVIYTGHNEFLERRTYSGLFDQGRTLVTVRAALDRLNVYRGLKRLVEPLIPSGPISGKTRMKGEVKAILDQSAGPALYHRDEEFSHGVVRHFAYNLRRMVRMCRDAGVPVILVEPACNLRDFSPFKSEHGRDLDRREKRAIETKLVASQRSIEREEYGKALELLKKCLRADPLYARTLFLMGKAQLGLGRTRDARDSFIRAKDLDVCPLRAVSPILQRVRRIAREESVPLIRFRRVLAEMAGDAPLEADIPGSDRFLDHVHPIIRGHQRLAEAILDRMVKKRMVDPSGKLSRQDKEKLYAGITKGFDRKFFAMRDLNLAKVLRWAGKKKEADTALLRAAKTLDSHPEIHKMLGSRLLDRGEFDRAVEEYEKAVKLAGNEPTMVYALAVAYFKAGRKKEAERTYLRLTDKGEAIPAAYSNLALIHLGSGRTEQAIDLLKKGLDKMPDSASLAAGYGLALAVSGKPSEGIPWMQKALEKEPARPEYLYNLAGMYALTGKKEKALETLQEAVAAGYSDADKLTRDPVFRSIRQDDRFRSIVRSIR
jgi:Flp pilus assembly protein TadD/lysophospholipase L1-like esterase